MSYFTQVYLWLRLCLIHVYDTLCCLYSISQVDVVNCTKTTERELTKFNICLNAFHTSLFYFYILLCKLGSVCCVSGLSHVLVQCLLWKLCATDSCVNFDFYRDTGCHVIWISWLFKIFSMYISANFLNLWRGHFLCRLQSIAAHRDHFVRRLSVRLCVSVCPTITLSW